MDINRRNHLSLSQRDIFGEQFAINNGSLKWLASLKEFYQPYVIIYQDQYVISDDYIHNNVFIEERAPQRFRDLYIQCFNIKKFIEKIKTKKHELYNNGIDYKDFDDLSVVAINNLIFFRSEYNINLLKKCYKKSFDRNKFTDLINDELFFILQKEEQERRWHDELYESRQPGGVSIYDDFGVGDGNNVDDDDDDTDDDTFM